MTVPVPSTWTVSGVFASKGVAFSQGIVKAFNKLSDGSLFQMAETGLSADGSYTLTFSSWAFQQGDTSIEYPALIVYLYDYQGNILWKSDVYAAPETPFSLGTFDISASQDDTWVVEGNVFYNSTTPLKSGLVTVYDLQSSGRVILAQASLNTKGYFYCSYPKSAFQVQDPTRVCPDLEIVVRNSSGTNIATYDVPAPVSAHQAVQIKLSSVPDVVQSDLCKVYGSVKNALGYPLSKNLSVAAYCLYYKIEEKTESGQTVKVGSFVKIPLHTAPVDVTPLGVYTIYYDASKIPDNLRLDSKETTGTDKASIYAEVRYLEIGSTVPKRFISAPLVFNGQSSQEINFVLTDIADTTAQSEYESLDEALNIYLSTVIAYTETIKVNPQDKIAEFLESVTRLPLVVHREDLNETKVRAYFKANQLYYEICSAVTAYSYELCPQFLYPLVLESGVINISTLLALGLDGCVKELRRAISLKFIKQSLTTDDFRVNVWEKLQKSETIAKNQENTFSAYHLFYLFFAKELDLNSETHKPSFANMSSVKENLDALLDEYTKAGSSYRALIERLKNPPVSGGFLLAPDEIERLTLLIDLCEFCDWYSDLVVCAFINTQGSLYQARNLKQLLVYEKDFLAYDPENVKQPFWEYVIEGTSLRYKSWDTEAPLALPIALFPGTTVAEQKSIAARTLTDKLKTKFPQNELLNKLEKIFALSSSSAEAASRAEWLALIQKLNAENGPWLDFDLNSSDLDQYLSAHPAATVDAAEKLKIQSLQRLYRLTDNVSAVSYLVLNDFDSATKIAQVSEEQFVAEYGLGLGDKKLATDIHRLAVNFATEASLNVEKYHLNLNESGNELLAVPRSLAATKSLLVKSAAATNIAKARMITRSMANWKVLFGKMNNNTGTEGQSILSISAYLLDLLEFLKSGNAYGKFIRRRPDFGSLKMTKANAEIPLPTIDLAVELLECLAASSVTGTVVPVCNQTPQSATATALRAEPLPWESVQGQALEASALAVMMTHAYPMNLPRNFYRDKATALLSNVSLTYSALARKLGVAGCHVLPTDALAKKLLSYDIAVNDTSAWILWGLQETGNSLYFPDKSSLLQSKPWYEILRHLAFVLDRAGLSYSEFVEILTSSAFSNSSVSITSDSESYQLADVDGYALKYGDTSATETVRIAIATSFFYKLSAFVRRKDMLGWSAAEIAQTWEKDADALLRIQNLKKRLGVSVETVRSWILENLTTEELEAAFPIAGLFDAYANQSALLTADVRNKMLHELAVAASLCQKVTADEAASLLTEYWICSDTESVSGAFFNGLNILYRYSTWIAGISLSVSEYLFLKHCNFGVEPGSFNLCDAACDNLDLLNGSSLQVSDLIKMLSPNAASVEDDALTFAASMNSAIATVLSEFKTTQDSGAQAVATEDYEMQILSLLKTLAAEDGALYLKELETIWKNSAGTGTEACRTWLNAALHLMLEAEDGIVDTLFGQTSISAGLALFYEDLCEEISAERMLSILAEKFAIDSQAVLELLFKLGSGTRKDFAAWLEIARQVLPVGHNAVELYCRLSRASVVYQYVGVADPGFEGWDWNNLAVLNAAGYVEYSQVADLIRAYRASSAILGKCYNYSELAALSCEGDAIQMPQEAFETILAYAGISTSASGWDLKDPAKWDRAAEVLSLYSKTKCLPELLTSLLADGFTVENISGNADNFKNYTQAVATFHDTLKRSYTDSSWNDFIQVASDALRKSKRDSLASFVCWESQQALEQKSYPDVFLDASDIYSYYLLDVKMEPDMSISRTVQAVSCIQLFVQRALMGLEGYSLSDSQKAEWEWMKNYQVWVANRKVFLYPENWVEGDLRLDKTPFFEELEDRIAECGDDQDALNTALGEYLEKVRDTAEMDVIGACKEDGGTEPGVLYTLHIVGRTRGAPHRFYYRKYMATALYGGSWTPWQELDFEIEGNIAQPVIFKGRLYILWLQVLQGQRQKKEGEDNNTAAMSVEYYAEIRLMWTSYSDKKWTGVKTGKNAVYDTSSNILDFTLDENENIADRYLIVDASDNSDSIELHICRTYASFTDGNEQIFAIPVASNGESKDASTYILKTVIHRTFNEGQNFVIVGNMSLTAGDDDSATSISVPYNTAAPVSVNAPKGSVLRGNCFVHKGGALELADGSLILGNSRGSFRVLSVNMAFMTDQDLPFFYMDERGTYLVRKVSADGRNGANSVQSYRFELMTNPQAGDFYKKFRNGGTKWLHQRETQALPVSDSYYYSYSYYNYYFSVYLGYYMAGDWQAWDLSQSLFENAYLPNYAKVAEPYPVATVDFCWGSATSIYNWELFFFVPMLLADKMIAEQDYAAALEWLQLVFDPRTDLTDYEETKRFVRGLPKGAKYWKFLPFFANPDADKSVLNDVAFPTARDTLPDRAAVKLLIDKWKNDPFDPHLIARYRPAAYQKYVVMKYLDTLIAWGDDLFTKDTTESINLAVQLYVLAADLLGPRAAAVPDPKCDAILSVNEILSNGTGALNEAFVSYENTVLSTCTREKRTPQRLLPGKAALTTRTTEMMFYFNVPRNETLMGYWDTVADRLYKIRNSENIEGVKRSLALFAPPIDPAMLVRAKAAGVSISDALADSSSALPYYRFKVMLEKAFDITRDVQRLGQQLLLALEKKDAETLAQLRVTHEQAALALDKTVRDLETTELEKELESAETEQDNAKAEDAQQTAYYTTTDLERKYDKMMEKVLKVQETVEKIKKAASIAYKMPDFDVGGILNGLGGPSFDIGSIGGTKIADNLVSAAEAYASRFAQRQVNAAKIKLQSEAERALQNWTMKKTVKANEIKSAEKRIVTAQIKIQRAEKNSENLEKELERKDEVYTHLNEKFTNAELYTWLKTELGSLYKTMFQLAVKVARKAEKCYHFEIGDTDLGKEKTFIKGSGAYWNGLQSGLLAGETLLADLHAMEVAYLENDKLEQEITVPVSLKDVDCVAFRKLQSESTCTFTIPMAFFDMDFPGHYFRRIRSVRMEIECGRNENQVVSAELTLNSNSLYTNSSRGSIENRIGVQSFATSQAQCKDGKFSFEFGSEKYKPFEGAGCDKSTWSITLPSQMKRFDYMDITDVKLYISYTARSGKMAADVAGEWNASESQWGAVGLVHEIQLSKDMPELYEEIKNGTVNQHVLSIEQIKACLPYEMSDDPISLRFWLRGGPSLGSIYIQPSCLVVASLVPYSLIRGVEQVATNISIDSSLLDKSKDFDLFFITKYKAKRG